MGQLYINKKSFSIIINVKRRLIELSQVYNKYIFKWLSLQASVAEGGEYP